MGEHIYCGVVVDFLVLLVVDDVGWILVLVVEVTAAVWPGLPNVVIITDV